MRNSGRAAPAKSALRDGDRGRALRVRGERLEGQDPLERAHTARAKLRSRRPAKLGEGLGGGPRGAVDAGRQHRGERGGDVDAPSAERDLLSPQPVRIAGPVEALVVVANRGDGVVQESQAVDDAW